MQQLQKEICGLESDQAGDFNFYLGDLNYRLKTTFEDLAPQVNHFAVRMAKINDQLVDARTEGYYPNYVE